MRPSELFRPTFRVKLLLALLGTITPLLLVTLLVVRREADRQVDIVVENRTRNAGDAFARIEHIRQQQLNQLGARLANSNRWGAALQEALEGWFTPASRAPWQSSRTWVASHLQPSSMTPHCPIRR